MKSSAKLIVLAIILSLVSASAENISNNLEKEPSKSIELDDNSKSDEQQDVISALEAALAITKQQDVVKFNYYNMKKQHIHVAG